jgi:anionic cell wall polymer biosynthesis LytR-Cps2A-Psr (LCP) family protein
MGVIRKGLLPLFVMIALATAGILAFALSVSTETAESFMSGDRIINMLFIVEDGGRPISTQLVFVYPANHRCAILDLPSDTGMIIKSLKRTDAISVLYDPADLRPYVSEIEIITDAKFPYWMVVDLEGLRRLTDLLDGLELFMPNELRIETEKGVIVVPGGVSRIDGGKFAAIARYKIEEESYVAEVERRQQIFKTLFKRIGQRAEYLVRDDVFSMFSSMVRTNLDANELRRLAKEFQSVDIDRIATQRVNGFYKTLDGKPLLFPVYEGDLIPSQVMQTLNALPRSGVFDIDDRVFQIEILNGMEIKGIAKKTADLFESFGYQVLSYGNADRFDYSNTIIYDRFGNSEAAKALGDLINCVNITNSENQALFAESSADFIIVLGKDFNGRICVR